MLTLRQRRGAFAEDVAVHWLVAQGWRVIARNVKCGKDEIDVIAVDPNAPHAVVCVEVRSARSPRFGTPEERVTARKVKNLYRASRTFYCSDQARDLRASYSAVRVDLVVVDLRSAQPQIRHLKNLQPA